MAHWKDIAVQREYYNEMARRAEQKRRARTAYARRMSGSRFYHGALVVIGRWFVAIGCRLQARYGIVAHAKFESRHERLAPAGGSGGTGR